MRPVTLEHVGSPAAWWRTALEPAAPHLRQVGHSCGEQQEFLRGRREVPGPAELLFVELADPLAARGVADAGGTRQPLASGTGPLQRPKDHQ
jgi:hypothetical protein